MNGNENDYAGLVDVAADLAVVLAAALKGDLLFLQLALRATIRRNDVLLWVTQPGWHARCGWTPFPGSSSPLRWGHGYGIQHKQCIPVGTRDHLPAYVDHLLVILTLVQDVCVGIEELAQIVLSVLVAEQAPSAFLS